MAKANHRKRNILLVIIALLICAAVIFVWSTSGNKGQIDPVPLTKQPTRISDKTFDGKYISFRHSGKYIPHTIAAKDQDLEISMLNANTTYDKSIAVAVSQLPGGQLTANSAYNLRASQTSLYTSRKVAVGDDTAIVWVKNDNTEQTAIIAHAGKVAVLAFTTARASDNLQSEVDNLLATFVWK